MARKPADGNLPKDPVVILDTPFVVRELAIAWPDSEAVGFVDITLSTHGPPGQALLDLLASWGFSPPMLAYKRASDG